MESLITTAFQNVVITTGFFALIAGVGIPLTVRPVRKNKRSSNS